MSTIVIVDTNSTRRYAYVNALTNKGYNLVALGSDQDAINFLIRQRLAPDVVILNMQWPESLEMIVLTALRRLPHLSRTKIVVVKRMATAGQRPPHIPGVDVCLAAPVSHNQLHRVVQEFLTKFDKVSSQTTSNDTRVWWENTEAAFIRWTDQALVFAWSDSTETAVKMPRGAVIRLMKEGILRIEGHVPPWMQLNIPDGPNSDVKYAAPVQQQASHLSTQNQSTNTPQHFPRQSSLRQHDTATKSSSKLNIVARLIHKLTGGSSATSPGKASQVPTSLR